MTRYPDMLRYYKYQTGRIPVKASKSWETFFGHPLSPPETDQLLWNLTVSQTLVGFQRREMGFRRDSQVPKEIVGFQRHKLCISGI